MRNFLFYGGRFLAVILAPFAILLTLIAVIVGAMIPALDNQENIKASFQEQNIYRDVVPVILPALLNLQSAEEEVAPNLSIMVNNLQDSLNPDDWRAVINELIPPDWVQSQLESVVDGIYAYLEGDESVTTIQYQVDIDTIAQRMTGESSERVITRISTLSTPCTSEQAQQIRNIDLESITNLEDLPICSPATENDTEQMQAILRTIFDQLASAIESERGMGASAELGELSVTEQIDNSGQAQLNVSFDQGYEILIGIRVFYQTYDLYIPIFIFLPIAMTSLIVFLAVRSFRGFARWVGTLSILVALNLIIFQLIIAVGLITIPKPEPDPTNNIPIEVLQVQNRILNGLFSAAFAEFAQPVAMHALQFLVVGVILLVLSWVVRKPPATIHIKETV